MNSLAGKKGMSIKGSAERLTVSQGSCSMEIVIFYGYFNLQQSFWDYFISAYECWAVNGRPAKKKRNVFTNFELHYF
jgi:hypothetical protein